MKLKTWEHIEAAIVEDWTSKELARFEGPDAVRKAIEWKENHVNEVAKDYASTDPESLEEIQDGISEDLYIYAWDNTGKIIDNLELG